MSKHKNVQVYVKNSGFFTDFWHYRHVFFVLIKQQFFLMYNRAFFGIIWSILDPLIYLTILVFVFSHVARFQSSQDIPFVLIVFSGLLGWNFFSHFIIQSSNLLRSGQSLMSKIYFPRIFYPYCCVGTLFVEFLIGTLILLILTVLWHYPVHLTFVFIPLIFLLGLIAYSGPMLITAILSFKYKDFQYLVPFLIQIGFYLSPIWFNPENIQNSFLLELYYCNPVVGVIMLIRTAIIGHINPLYYHIFVLSGSMSLLLLIIGLLYWKNQSKKLMDII